MEIASLRVQMTGGRGALLSFALSFSPAPLLYRLLLDRVVLLEPDQVLDLLTCIDAVLRAEPGECAGGTDLLERTLSHRWLGAGRES